MNILKQQIRLYFANYEHFTDIYQIFIRRFDTEHDLM